VTTLNETADPDLVARELSLRLEPAFVTPTTIRRDESDPKPTVGETASTMPETTDEWERELNGRR
jgi:hypothetical protein